jgi:hypothetical protein
MLVASELLTGADSPLEVILGVGVLLLFAGVLARALAARWPSRGRGCAHPDKERCGPRPGSDATERSASHVQDQACGLREPGSAAAEPELARLKAETLAPLACILDTGRRLGAAEDRIAGELAALPGGFWLMERNVPIDGRRIPFLVLGATGVYLVCASDGAWTLHDLHVLSELGGHVRQQLPGYDGKPRAAVCLAFDDMKPRAWFDGEQRCWHGGWVLGVNWLQRWIFGFGPEHGLRNGDIRRLDEASGPFWDRRSTARLPANPNFG